MKIFGGEGDNDEQSLSSVVALKVGRGGTFELCSGVLVAPNIVLTARHCVANSITTSVSCDENGQSTNGSHVAGDQAPGDVAIYTGASPRFGETPVAVGSAIVAPKSEYLCDADIALVVLDRAITEVKPIGVRLTGGVAPGETVRSVGYGQNDQRMPIGTRLRRAGVSILAMGSGVSESKTALGPHEFEVGKSICQGDSGGPAIAEGTGAVVGVVSRGGECNDDYGHIYTTTAGWRRLFDDAFAIAGGAPIEEATRPTSSTAGLRATPVPVPDAPARGESCSAGRGPASGGSSAALLVAAAIVLRLRSGRAPRARES
ncbi:MAG TPA: trypsin-like serine protease [Labilithrix sp.]|nr:trypsin-like serine protease [Labilithrix sp.]